MQYFYSSLLKMQNIFFDLFKNEDYFSFFSIINNCHVLDFLKINFPYYF